MILGLVRGKKQAQMRVMAVWMYTAVCVGNQKSVLETQISQLSFERTRCLIEVGGSLIKCFPCNTVICFLKCLFFLM